MDSPRVTRAKGATPLRTPTDDGDTSRLLQAQIRRLEDQFNKLREQVRQTQQLAALGTAAAMMAHEYNNVMTPVVGYARFAADSNDPELMKKALHMTLRQTSVLSGMSERILGLAVNEAQTFQPTTLKPVVEEAVATMCRDPAKDGITLRIDIPDDLRVLADGKQLRQVFFNLLLNAHQAIKHRSGRIVFEADRTDNGQVEVRVRDNGCGIKPEHIDSIFEAFFTTKGPSEGKPRDGCGLGLALCHDIITDHRGQITAQSQPNQGTTFTITLPAAD